MRPFGFRRVAILGTVAMMSALGSALPAHAGSTGAGDGFCDTLDPFLVSSNAQPGSPHCGGVTDGKYVDSPKVDVVSYSLSSTSIAGMPALHAVITMNAPLPAPGTLATDAASSGAYPGFTGLSARVLFNNARTQDNTRFAVCQRFLQPDHPVYFYRGHYGDGFQLFVGADLTVNAGVWKLSPNMGYYDPAADGGYLFYDAVDTMPNGFGSVSGNTIDVTMPVQFRRQAGGTCFGSGVGALDGTEFDDFARGGDRIFNVKAMSYLNLTTTSPVTLDLTAAGQGKIDNVGGFIYTEDWASDAGYDIGLVTGTPDNFSAQDLGPGCPSPTFGDNVPNQPLYTANQSCMVNNFVGPGFGATGQEFVL